MNARIAISLVLGLAICAGSGCNSKKAQMREQTKDFNDIADALSSVKDMASYEAAKPKLEPIYAKQREEMRKAMEQAKKNAGSTPAGQPSSGDVEKARKEFEAMKNDPDFAKFEEASKRYIQELTRVMLIPEVGKRFMKEMMGI